MPADPDVFAGETLDAQTIRDLALFDTWSPTLTASTSNPTMGTGAVLEGDVHWNGRFYEARLNITFGTAGAAAGTGNYQIDLPADLTIDSEWTANYAVGIAELNDSGTGRAVVLRTSSSTRLIARLTDTQAVWASTNVPMGNNDFIRGRFAVLGA